jgi:hypothetical protein
LIETASVGSNTPEASFRASFIAPSEPGTYEITSDIEGIGKYDDYLVVVPK